jgi:hypothetical protein
VKLTSNHISYRKQVGILRGKPVWEIETTGGLYLLVVAKSDGGVDTLGTGPHVAIARHIAKKRAPELQITEICKSGGDFSVELFKHLLPQFTELTNRFNK